MHFQFANRQESVLAERNIAERNNGRKEFWSSGDIEGDVAVEFGSLFQYGMRWLPDRPKNLSIAYNSWMQHGMPRYLKDEENASHKAIIDDLFDISGLEMFHFPIRVGNNGSKDEKKKFII